MTAFGKLLLTFRLRSGFKNLSQLADAFAEKGYIYEISTFCRWQKGKRIPTKRKILLVILEVFDEINPRPYGRGFKISQTKFAPHLFCLGSEYTS